MLQSAFQIKWSTQNKHLKYNKITTSDLSDILKYIVFAMEL